MEFLAIGIHSTGSIRVLPSREQVEMHALCDRVAVIYNVNLPIEHYAEFMQTLHLQLLDREV